jgi:hypothetical protein
MDAGDFVILIFAVLLAGLLVDAFVGNLLVYFFPAIFTMSSFQIVGGILLVSWVVCGGVIVAGG